MLEFIQPKTLNAFGDNPRVSTPKPTPSCELTQRIHQAIALAGGWLGFDRFMAMALYEPGLGYYTNALQKFGAMPSSGSDFVTAPGMSPLFGQTLAVQVRQALQATGTDEIWEFGAGTGALALQLLDSLGDDLARYTIIDLSGTLRARQADTLLKYADKVRWLDNWPKAIEGVVVGNEVLDAMPVHLLQRTDGVWHERGVVSAGQGFAWQDRPTDLRPPIDIEGEHDYLTEIHPQAEAFITSLAERLLAGKGGAAFFLDYGFPEAEYFHPQRHMGTVMCHQLHQADDNPLLAVGQKDITAHVNFTGVALAAQNAGLAVLGYASQAWFLLNLGLAERMAQASLAERSQAQRLVNEHEMGELFKVIGLTTSADGVAQGFARGDRSHRL
ncbi:SAM-dependent methyltransferase [Limnohabitans sp.]|jgi:SAM-dependent MidA family methyltransferase|uniref:class I SAM-dependent methyltransferase n=1 Tax=Limnohabitans sp. TaxID=1907725 RepID=UPI00289A26D8|nr:SAM-dependent methyltransferase [Limnohabitans sp.]